MGWVTTTSGTGAKEPARQLLPGATQFGLPFDNGNRNSHIFDRAAAAAARIHRLVHLFSRLVPYWRCYRFVPASAIYRLRVHCRQLHSRAPLLFDHIQIGSSQLMPTAMATSSF